VEFCRLFIHPAVCLPLAGRWASGYHAEHFSVRRWVHEDDILAGLPPHLEELSDSHVAKILAVRAGMAGLPEDRVQGFEAEMIRPWSEAFGARLLESSEQPLYRAVGALIGQLGR
jgi:TorA maturation chaperone TorD